MSHHNSFSLNEDELKRTWFNPELILKDSGLQSGMVFSDVGCGDGFFSLLTARIVDPSGTVYAVDSNVAAIEKLKHKAAEQGLRKYSRNGRQGGGNYLLQTMHRCCLRQHGSS